MNLLKLCNKEKCFESSKRFFSIGKKLFSNGEVDSGRRDVLDDFESTVENLVPRNQRITGTPHQVFIIQPYIKWGPQKLRNTTPELQLEESVALVKTLPGWKVVDTKIMSTISFDKKAFFNSGNLTMLSQLVNKRKEITAVFINVKHLQLHQHLALENTFGIPVFDRYGIVINIFKRHAKTKEAKLQVALAQLPYFWSRIKGIHNEEESFTPNVGIGSETFQHIRLRLLKEQESKIKKELSTLAKSRVILRSKRKEMKLPTVAIVGYTNAGKTSLIKCLTESESLEPEDKLFATLDVTVHEGMLDNRLKVLYVDTIGFISDVPSNLIEPFVVTLEDAVQADLIVHVQDVSHPDRKAQYDEVVRTINSLDVSEKVMNNIITVCNKCDRVDDIDAISDDSVIYTSCKDGTGLDELKATIERRLFATTDLAKMKIRVSSGSEEYHWLFKEAAVSDVVPDEKDQQFVLLTVTIHKVKLAKFKHKFIKQKN
ncbi:putative GTP-binding protein 6 [Cimex lectularius]|uniref:Hflx-type G domain-containing protein n=1 Tax=Cimex lectularius TaxID=79782 RepID=A0A8I6RTB9_CIMLE|nr:putative GTP-binding protein 6 [Cimex lectularius]